MIHFAKLYLDEDVSVILAKVLSGRGFDVLTAKDGEMLRKSDEAQLLFGIKHSRTVLTHNRRHFETLHSDFVHKQLEHSGIVIAGRRDVYEMARRIALLLNAIPADLFSEPALLYLIITTDHLL